MDYLRSGSVQHLPNVGEALGNTATFSQLFGHQQFPVTETYKLAIGNAANSADVLIGHFPAPNYRYAQHH
jgi:hypothetical protein